jgi:hypothetical protein
MTKKKGEENNAERKNKKKWKLKERLSASKSFPFLPHTHT